MQRFGLAGNGMERIIGIDLGGTFIKFGFFRGEKLIKSWKVPTEEKNIEHVFEKIACEVNKLCEQEKLRVEELDGIGMGIPGSVNNKGIVISAPNLGWSMVDVYKEIRQRLDVPVLIANDANVAALGEQYFGIGKGCDSLVFVTLGTGVGGGVIVNQRLVPGAFGGGGELGHMLVCDTETQACACGNYGCLEQYASATGITRMAERFLEETKQFSVLRGQDKITAKEIFDAVKEKDALAIEVAEVFGKTLGRALALAACVVDPQMFVIGGGVSAAGEVLLEYITKYYKRYAFLPSKKTPFCLASLGNDAGIYGAARLVLLEKECKRSFEE